MEEWTWGEAGEQALYGIISVFIILILLTVLTMLSGRIITRIEKSRNSNDASGRDTESTGS